MLHIPQVLEGKVGLVVGVANGQSIAAGCASAFAAAGADLVLTYLNDKALPHVTPVAEAAGGALMLPLDVEAPGQMEAVFAEITARFGRLDFLLHSIASCPKDDLHGRVVDCSRDGFCEAMDVSVHSLIRMAHLAEPLMHDGGSILTVSYYGAERVVANYNVMGPVKAALESVVRALAVELGPRRIRVNALSPGPLATRAASGIAHFDALIEQAKDRSPEHRLVTIEEIGQVALNLVSSSGVPMTGNITFIDAGLHVLA